MMKKHINTLFLLISLIFLTGCEDLPLVYSGDFLREPLQEGNFLLDRRDVSAPLRADYGRDLAQIKKMIQNLSDPQFLKTLRGKSLFEIDEVTHELRLKMVTLWSHHREALGKKSSEADQIFAHIHILALRLILAHYYAFLSAEAHFLCARGYTPFCAGFERMEELFEMRLKGLNLSQYVDDLISWMEDLQRKNILIAGRNHPGEILRWLFQIRRNARYYFVYSPLFPVRIPVFETSWYELTNGFRASPEDLEANLLLLQEKLVRHLLEIKEKYSNVKFIRGEEGKENLRERKNSVAYEYEQDLSGEGAVPPLDAILKKRMCAFLGHRNALVKAARQLRARRNELKRGLYASLAVTYRSPLRTSDGKYIVDMLPSMEALPLVLSNSLLASHACLIKKLASKEIVEDAHLRKLAGIGSAPSKEEVRLFKKAFQRPDHNGLLSIVQALKDEPHFPKLYMRLLEISRMIDGLHAARAFNRRYLDRLIQESGRSELFFIALIPSSFPAQLRTEVGDILAGVYNSCE